MPCLRHQRKTHTHTSSVSVFFFAFAIHESCTVHLAPPLFRLASGRGMGGFLASRSFTRGRHELDSGIPGRGACSLNEDEAYNAFGGRIFAFLCRPHSRLPRNRLRTRCPLSIACGGHRGDSYREGRARRWYSSCQKSIMFPQRFLFGFHVFLCQCNALPSCS